MRARHTAPVLVGCKNDCVAKDGLLRGVVEEPGRADEVVRNTPLLIGALRPTPVTITTTVMGLEADCQAMSDMPES